MSQNVKGEVREAVTIGNEGQKIFAVLHKPAKFTGKIPAVVICPGFAGNKSGKFRIFVRLAQKLAENGVATLRFDYRGSGDSEGDFREITIQRQVSDALAAFQFLANLSEIDANRIGILGRSLGGVISVLAAKKAANIKSLVLWAPVFKSDPWKQLWENYQTQRAEVNQRLTLPAHLPELPNLEFLTQFFGLNIQEDMKSLCHVPLLHIHGKNDQVVKIDHAMDYKKMRQEVVLSRFIELPNSDHDFSDPVEQEVAIDETLRWFVKTL